LSELTTLRDQLKTGLSGAASEAADESQPKVSELAERIKALKAAHTIEATPQRAGKRRAAAEEPVTARIRKRTEASNATGAGSEHGAVEPLCEASSANDSSELAMAQAPSADSSPPRRQPPTPRALYQESAARGR
jgi:hypothetical protein